MPRITEWQSPMMKDDDSDQTKTAIEHIREVTGWHFAQLLFAWLLLLCLLVKEASELSDGLQVDVHQWLWLLLQVQPQLFDKGPGIPLHDVFSSITWSLWGVTLKDLTVQIEDQYNKLQTLLLKAHIPETNQHTTPPLLGCFGKFRSYDNITKHNILQKIWVSWSELLGCAMCLVLALRNRYQVSSSQKYLFIFHLHPIPLPNCTQHWWLWGSWYSMCIHNAICANGPQQSALEEVPQPCVGLVPWTVMILFFLLLPLKAKCNPFSRYQSTATLIALILQGGYQSPHHTLDQFVEAFTGFQPTDGGDVINHEPQLLPVLVNQVATMVSMYIRFCTDGCVVMFPLIWQFLNDSNPSLLTDAPQADTLCSIIYDQLLYGHYTLDTFSAEEKEPFIKYRFARDNQCGTICSWWATGHACSCMVAWSGETVFPLYCLHRNISNHALQKMALRHILHSTSELYLNKTHH